MKIGVHFSDIFNVSRDALENYGAFNISLIADMPLFIDPFLLFSSEKPEYQALHKQILDYLSFLKIKADAGITDEGLIYSWYTFPERKQNWFGYSQLGNSGRGLGRYFARNMHTVMPTAFKDLGQETITATSHLEKVSLFNPGVGRDNISDFTTNIILDYLLTYTETFAKQHLSADQCGRFRVKKAVFDYKLETWIPRTYTLPRFQNDYVILTPKDILTRDETWINHQEMLDRFDEISAALENEELRALVNNYFRLKLPTSQIPKKEMDKFVRYARWETIRKYPELVEYYISAKEDEKDEAKSIADDKVRDAEHVLVNNVQLFLTKDMLDKRFFEISPEATFTETLQRVKYLKDCIEKNDGYRIFYVDGKPVKRESDLQLLFRFVWYATILDVNREVNNGRGPADYKISYGADNSTIVEFKLANNTSLKKNLANQLEKYMDANNTQFGIKVIMFFTTEEQTKVNKILRDLNLDNKPNVILIDARMKKSASKVDGTEV